MPRFQAINNINEIDLNSGWTDSVKFTSRDRIVDDTGKTPAADYAGHRYQLISKKQRNFSLFERLERGFLGTLRIVRSLGRDLFSKPVRDLFTKKYETIRFGLLVPPSKASNEREANGIRDLLQLQAVNEASLDLTLSLPAEVMLGIFSCLDSSADLERCSHVNRRWQALAIDLWKEICPPTMAIGKAAWATHFGDIGEEPLLPRDIQKTLESPCVIWPGKRVEEKHILFLSIETLDGEPLPLDRLGEIVKSPKGGGTPSGFKYFWAEIINALRDQPALKPRWCLMTNDVIPGSRGKSPEEQTALVAELAQKTGIPYEVPSVKDAALGIVMHHVHTGERLFGDNPWTYTRCKKLGGFWPAVGGFAPAGLDVHYFLSYYGYDDIGVAALRKF